MNELRLYEELLLLALHDEKGTLLLEPRDADMALAAAALTELILLERAKIIGAANVRAEVLDLTPTGDRVLDRLLERLSTGRERNIVDQLRRLAATRSLRAFIGAQLARDGVLRTETTSYLRLFSRTAHPEVNPLPEQKLRARITAAVTSAEEVDERTMLLVALAHENGLLDRAFGTGFVEEHADRIKELRLDLRVRHPSHAASGVFDDQTLVAVMLAAGMFG